MYTREEGWKMSEPEKVLAIIKELGVWVLGNWDGCCCSKFSIRNVDVDIACGKGRNQGVYVSSDSMDYLNQDLIMDEDLLRPIAEEVAKQCDEHAWRSKKFEYHIRAWDKEKDSYSEVCRAGG